MAKCILLSRVSTHSQDLKQQTDELINAAYRDGYGSEDMIIIEDKESAIKLSEEERNGLNELKYNINTNRLIDCVYVYEVSRIARKEKILYSIRDFLIEKNIQLVVLNPYMKLLDENYNMTQASQIMFAMFGAFSESEMHIKKQRMMRGKRARMEAGYYVGGNVLFGYKLENKRFVIDEVQAKTVRKMFNMYKQGESLSSIATEFCATGEIKKLNWRQCYTHLHKLIQRPEYCGVGHVSQNIGYPPIIDKQLFDEVQALLHDRRRPHSKVKYIYYAHKLLRVKKDNRCFVPSAMTKLYKYEHQEGLVGNRLCWNININLVDSIVWHYTKQYKRKYSVVDIKQARTSLEDKIHLLNCKIEKVDSDINEYENMIIKTNERIIKGKMDEEQGDKMIRQFKDEIRILKENQAGWETSLLNLSNEYHLLDMGIGEHNVDNVMDEQQRYDIIHQCIKVIWVDKVKYGRYKFEMVFEDSSIVEFETVPNNFNRVLTENGWQQFDRIDRF